ncbi:small ribosomal subunit protein bS16m-like [Lepidochelys kempii]|uniref:small ribosomal subunit protein bS16m-like n=1 Tax=Lepidochelys kempii TaxID=8472 RepID=UPI003C700B05
MVFFLFQVLSRVIMVHLAHLLMKNDHGGHVAIRLALGGCANRPFFRIVAAYNKRARDSKYLEQVGCYDPLPNSHNEKLVGLNIERIKHWIGCGAHVTKPVEKLLGNSSGGENQKLAGQPLQSVSPRSEHSALRSSP